MSPSKQTELYGLNRYFNEIRKLYDNRKMPNKILFSGNKGSGKSTLTYHIINYIFSNFEENKYDIQKFKINSNNRSFNLIQNGTHPNFYLIDLIDGKKNIEVNQIRPMIAHMRKSSFNEIPRFVLINNVENLNKNSSNALLKIIEEPNENIFFILIHNSSKNILPTLKSRCLTFKINLTFYETIEISNFLLKENIFQLIHNDLINYYKTPGYFFGLVNFAKEKKINLNEYSLFSFLNYLIDNKFYKKNKFINDLIIDNIELYFLKIYKMSNTKNTILNTYYNFMNKINNTNKFNLDEESLFMEFKSKLLNG
tara:strand:- start:1292 stop:2224 length:933 start_codon:yes stop_codon:yes gene_type:complete